MTDVRLTAINPEDSEVYPVACNSGGELRIEEIPDQTFKGDLDGDLTVSGTSEFTGDVSAGKATFTGEVDVSALNYGDSDGNQGRLNSAGALVVDRTTGTSDVILGRLSGVTKSSIRGNGEAAFAGGKAGFTREGNLFCTTVRGDLVVLDNTSGGFGAWIAYEPPSRESLKEKLEDWSEKDKPSKS
tara:strand:- start:312 stop:869 length:558 start_codon:yes stop_codon:yes gene_type:complete